MQIIQFKRLSNTIVMQTIYPLVYLRQLFNKRHNDLISYFWQKQRRNCYIIWQLFLNIIIWLFQAKMSLRAYADRKGPDKTAHLRSLIRAYAVRLSESLDTANASMQGKTLIRVWGAQDDLKIYVFCMCLKAPFRSTWSFIGMRLLSL